MASNLQLSSTQTALCLSLPESLSDDVNVFRKNHDKAYGRWPAHINILYPFVPLAKLQSALDALKKCLADERRGRIRVKTTELDVFRHHKSATLFLKPDEESTKNLSQLRRSLVASLGCSDTEGTHDGEYRPHMTLGQSAVTDRAIEFLQAKAASLVGLDWENVSLTVLKRDGPGGPMSVVDEIPFGDPGLPRLTSTLSHLSAGWRDCHTLTKQTNTNPTTSKEVVVSTINVMAEDFAPPFEKRFPLILNAIEKLQYVSRGTHVLCLQEVSPEMLPLILNEPIIRDLYPYTSHGPTSLLPSKRNQVTLAASKFTYFNLQFSEMHKASLIIRLTGLDVSVANIHLSSGLTDEAVETKQRQISRLAAFLTRNDMLERTVWAGDFNITTSSQTIQTAIDRKIIKPETALSVSSLIDLDVWTDAFLAINTEIDDHEDEDYFEGEEGATFDRLENPLATMNRALIDHRPQRYDRILSLKDGAMKVQDYGMTTLSDAQGHYGSDHYGVFAKFTVSSIEPKGPGMTKLNRAPLPAQVEKLQVIEDNMDVHSVIQTFLPTLADVAQRGRALQSLHDLLQTDTEDFCLVPLGSQAMGTYFASSDIDVLVIGSAPAGSFFEFAGEKLGSSTQLINSLVSVLETTIEGTKIDVQYCQAPELVAQHQSIGKTVAELAFDSSLLEQLHPSSLRPLNTYRDTMFLIESSPLPKEVQQTVHRFLALYLKRHGLYSAKFGYLGGIHLSLMLNRVAKLLAAQGSSDISPATLIRTFFDYYSKFNWRQDIVSDPTITAEYLTKRTEREPVYIRAIHTPTARPNVAASCSRLTADVITEEFTKAGDMLEKGQWGACIGTEMGSVSDFLNDAESFIQVRLSMWSLDTVSSHQIRSMVGAVESKLTHIMVDLSKSGEITGRVWPEKFISEGDESVEEATCYYLVAVAPKYGEDDYEDEKKVLLEGKVISAARSFEHRIKMSKCLNEAIANLDASIVPRKEIWDMSLKVDHRDWSTFGKTSQELAESQHDQRPISPSNAPEGRAPRRADNKAKSKLRPVQDIINRIKWDESYDVDNYIIGYEDRFDGVMEIPLSAWKTEQTDLEFIPSHRIVWIKRKGSDGERIWDRRMRYDAVFGSGLARKDDE